MGQYVVILTISAILLGGVLLYNARASTSVATAELSAYQTDRIAREASQIALRDIVRSLNARPDEWTDVLATAQNRFNIDTTAYEMGGNIATTYAAALTAMSLRTPTDSVDRVRLRVNGAFGNWSETTQAIEPTDFIAEAVYEREWVDVNVPAGFRQAIWSNGCINLDGGAQISGSLHANDCLTSSSSSFDVYGSGTYTGSESADDSRFYGDPPVARRDSILAPAFTLPPTSIDKDFTTDHTLDTSNQPTGPLPDGWYGVTGKGTPTNPYILYVSGNLTIDEPVRLLGHIRIYVSGSLTINSNASLSSVTAAVPNLDEDLLPEAQTWANDKLPGGTTIGLYVNGNVTLGGRTFLAATLYTNGAVAPSGTGPRMIVGGMVSRQTVNIGGDAKIYYKEGADSVYDPDIPREVPGSLRLVAYREWVCRPFTTVQGCP